MTIIFKRVFVIIISIIGLLVLFYFLFVNYYPSFGGDVSKEKQVVYQKSEQYREGKFNNIEPVPKEISFKDNLKIAYAFLTTEADNLKPKNDIKVNKLDVKTVANYKKEGRLIWFGHSSFLLQIEGKTILLDPMLSKVAAPHPLLGTDRFNTEFPLAIEEVPKIDAVIFSHDHYDHLDYETILKIKEKVSHFFVPLGVGVHLESWGVPSIKITELDWWEERQFEGISFVCTPAQHFSGRKLNNSQSTLWSSWVIKSKNENIYFGGDSGYASHFKEIGEKYGPFDIALLECGQYNEMWPDIHMTPEETVRAGIDVNAKKIMPIHWASFQLALHSWTDPVERIQIEAKRLNVKSITPKIGENIIIRDTISNYNNWWKALQ
jgi:L-ascorbate metabolism protein UlaG (beta-lactamase superfamily)